MTYTKKKEKRYQFNDKHIEKEAEIYFHRMRFQMCDEEKPQITKQYIFLMFMIVRDSCVNFNTLFHRITFVLLFCIAIL
ncbi:CLUMA_CG009472, isoform A [Clunio marinus]|uniref:CLUMA_CG009472, isoform A n=1 Tax=Clunio marinus TaxID=568069 RepID=A0A1J1IC74_9DIPT|nr:CLUMA_CG009472, isoform A [Clunio marinus]